MLNLIRSVLGWRARRHAFAWRLSPRSAYEADDVADFFGEVPAFDFEKFNHAGADSFRHAAHEVGHLLALEAEF